MRTRSLVAPEQHCSGAYTVTRDDGQVFPGQSPWTASYTPSSETITDSAKKVWLDVDGRSVLAMKPVSHSKWTGDFTGSMLSYHYPGSPGGLVSELDTRTWVTGVAHDVSLMALRTVRDHLSTVLGERLEAFYKHYERWLKVRPTMTSSANMAVFLGELRDVTRMWEILPRRHLKMSWREFAKWGNSLHLNWNFGWKPFQRELYAWADAARSFEQRYHDFVSRQRQLLTERQGEADTDFGYEWTDEIDGYWVRTYKSYIWVANRSAFQFSYDLPAYSPKERRVRAWLDSFGLHLTPKNLWALQPWSFVADWFLPISTALSRFDYEYSRPDTMIIQACSSVRIICQVHCGIKGPSTWGTPSGPLYSVNYEYYERAIGAPNFRWDSPSPLSDDKIRLLTSLVASLVL